MKKSIYKDLKKGLEEAIDYEYGKREAKSATYSIDPVETYSSKKIRQIRMDADMTQKAMAAFMGVSVKTIEAWERGTTHPTGPAKRLLHILENNDFNSINFVRPKIK